MLDLKEDKLQHSGKEEDRTFHKVHVLGINADLWGRVDGLGSETWKGFEWLKLLVFLIRLRGSSTISLIS